MFYANVKCIGTAPKHLRILKFKFRVDFADVAVLTNFKSESGLNANKYVGTSYYVNCFWQNKYNITD